MSAAPIQIQGAGLGLRKQYLMELVDTLPDGIAFFEIAPENWIDVGGKRGKQLYKIKEKYPIICHGLSLSIGGPTPLDITLLNQIKLFLDEHQINIYTEHLSYCSDKGQLYDLLPIPFTEEAVRYVANRIKQTQDILERTIGIENVSYYCAPGKEMEEAEFINAVLAESQCDLLLDINNTYVNSINHGYDPIDFLKQLTPNNICYFHMAGHYAKEKDLLIDTHGESVTHPVWDLLEFSYQHFGDIPTLLERDSNFPPLDSLLKELKQIQDMQKKG